MLEIVNLAGGGSQAGNLGRGRDLGIVQLQTAPARWLWGTTNSIALCFLYMYLLVPFWCECSKEDVDQESPTDA